MEKYKKFFINGKYSDELKIKVVEANSKNELFTSGGRIYCIENTMDEIYCIMNDLEYIPKCECGNELRIKTYKSGFQKFCSTKCSNKSNINDNDKSKYCVKKKFFNMEEITKDILSKYINVYGNVDTNFYKMCDFKITSEEVYLIYHNSSPRKCEMCNNRAVFINFKRGYGENCSTECSNKNPSRIEKIKKTSLEKDENGNNSYDRMVVNLTKTNMEKGRWFNYENLSNFEIYCRNVEKFQTKFNKDIKLLENFDKRGPGLDDYHLDHKYSKKQGFIDGIPEEIIGHICNLEMILGAKNLSKNKNCSITREELYENISSYTE